MSQLLLTGTDLTSGSPLEQALHQVQARLNGWASNSDAYNALLLQVFGVQISAATSALQASLNGTGLGICLEILDGATLSGINGAYTSAAPNGAEAIYLNSAWLQGATAAKIEAVLLEEIGHAIDYRLKGATDTRGDEGEIFSALLRGQTPSTRSFTEDDHRLITLNGITVAVEAASAPAPYMPAPSGSALTFSNHLFKPFVIDARQGGAYTIRETQVALNMGLLDSNGLALVDANGAPILTTEWVYELLDSSGTVVGPAMPDMPGMPGMVMTGKYNPTFLTSSGVPITVTWVNDLPVTGQFLPVDSSIMMGMGTTTMDPALVATVPHLHGGHAAAIYDGYPTLGFTQMGLGTTPGMAMNMGSSDTYVYDNSQQGAFIWYHDHTLGLTRLNVYAGMAASYFIEDKNHRDLAAAGVLPNMLLNPNDSQPNGSISLMIADRSFTADGQLYYPGASPSDPLPGTPDTVATVLPVGYTGPFPTAVPEFYGDTIIVNGQAWPHAHVAKGQVEFDMVNGSDCRIFILKLDNPWAKVTLLGTDGGLLEHPITIMDGDGVDEAGEQIVFSPGDRLQLLFDFTDQHISVADKIRLLNVGAAYEPFKGLNPDGTLQAGVDDLGNPVPVVAATVADPVGNIMQFNFSAATPTTYNLNECTLLNPNIPKLIEAGAKVRKLGIFEITDSYGRIMPMVGTAETVIDQNGNPVFGPLGWDAPVSEMVDLGATEVWEFFNATADAHPMHVHLGEFQMLGLYASIPTIDPQTGAVIGYELGDLIDTRSDLAGIQNISPEDTGLQDTVWLGPNEAIKIIMTFDRPGDYVWHCHMLSHEDHDMMRPFKVIGFAGDTQGAISDDSINPAQGLLEVGRVNDALQGFVAGTFIGAYGSLTLNTRGEWSYMVDQRALKLPACESGNDVFTVKELDGITTHTITVTVIGQNQAPIVTSAASISVPENSVGTIYHATASDPDVPTTLSWTLGGVDAPLFNFNGATGDVCFKTSPNYEAPADFGANNIYDIIVTASDGRLSSTPQPVAITVTNVNEAPTGTVTIRGTAVEGQTLTASNNLIDPDGIPSTGPGAITYQWQANGKAISGASSNTLLLTPGPGGPDHHRHRLLHRRKRHPGKGHFRTDHCRPDCNPAPDHQHHRAGGPGPRRL